MWDGPPIAVYQRLKVCALCCINAHGVPLTKFQILFAEGRYSELVASLRHFCSECPNDAVGSHEIGSLRARALCKLANIVRFFPQKPACESLMESLQVTRYRPELQLWQVAGTTPDALDLYEEATHVDPNWCKCILPSRMVKS